MREQAAVCIETGFRLPAAAALAGSTFSDPAGAPMTSLADLDSTIRLIVEFIGGMDAETEFVPR